MLKFEKIDMEAIIRMRPYLAAQPYRTCDYTPAGIFMWRSFFNTKYALQNQFLFLQSQLYGQAHCYAFPVGTGSVQEALSALREYVRLHSEGDGTLRLCNVPEPAAAFLREQYGSQMSCEMNYDRSDYVYLAEALGGMRGKKLHGPRNHMNSFQRTYPDHHYEAITADNLQAVIRFWNLHFIDQTDGPDFIPRAPAEAAADDAMGCGTSNSNGIGPDAGEQNHRKDWLDRMAAEEKLRISEILPLFEQLGLTGGALYVGKEIVAFAFGELMGDTLYVHVEKALTQYQGAYQMIASRFPGSLAGQAVYVNREEDEGDEGLRQSKLSYRPHEMLYKYFVTIRDF